ncbi:unnamed protein product [Cuscuta epithymum]|uniref:Glycosyltransferase n=1 Tax=Cuscuta epithymum TaxID=186058 RepID=A0AAV0EZ26_9ASTE|nr:unnamed protein product [Cuscuta epithymum]
MGGKGQHIILLPLPLQGHINPMLQFSKRLASKGVRVTILAPAFLQNSLQTNSGDGLIRLEPIPESYKPPDSIDDYLEWFETKVTQSFSNVIEKLSDAGAGCPPAKLVVYDSILPWAQDLARKNDLQGAVFFTQSCAVCGLYYLVYSGRLPVLAENSSGVSLPAAFPEMGTRDFPSLMMENGSQAYPCLSKMIVIQSVNIQKADWVLFNSFDSLEKEVVDWISSEARIMTIGPTIPSMYLDKRLEADKDYGMSMFKPNSEACTKWLDSRETASVVYVSFGSLASLGEKQMDELFHGLIKSNCHFLWVVRASEESKLPKTFLRPEKSLEKGLIVNWSPQLSVLSHSAIGCFMTHCGWNSTLEALSLGVPLVGMPQWTDQPTNAKYIADVWQVGVRVRVGDDGIVRSEEIERCIRHVMVGKESITFKRNALKWRDLAKEAVDEGGTTDKNIDEFLSSMDALGIGKEGT